MARNRWQLTYHDIKECRQRVKSAWPNATIDRSDEKRGIYRLDFGDFPGHKSYDYTSVSEVWLQMDAYLDYLGGC